ncbi:SERTA domain-containing protein 2-like [Pyxicephalus adspersus]|uniref:SERTA domain-containing protein n=1 Tax=Pyxicephalus adspersus TaxID=30357 RepID=A0AAV3A336_PYXAD|nr:TPA: hypothetical protein GDO54_017560 [Pyxicephalus adspersus]
MPTRGIKRKFSDWEGSELEGHLSFQTDSYSFYRQALLNMSLEKFNKGRTMLEPSLRRYVLIANTLRIIQEDIHHENPCPPMDNGIPATCDLPTGNVISSLLPPDLENIFLPPVEDEFSVSTAIASILRELESVLDESCPQGVQRPLVTQDPEAKAEPVNQVNSHEPFKEEIFNNNSSPMGDSQDIELLRQIMIAAACSENLPASAPVALPELPLMDTSSVLEPAPIPSTSHANAETPEDMDTSSPEPMEPQVPTGNCSTIATEDLKPSEPVFGSFEILRSSYLNDISFDDPFSDIDTSVFERESQSVGPSSTRLSASEDLWFPSYCSAPSYSGSQGKRENNDLDNSFEILVGS